MEWVLGVLGIVLSVFLFAKGWTRTALLLLGVTLVSSDFTFHVADKLVFPAHLASSGPPLSSVAKGAPVIKEGHGNHIVVMLHGNGESARQMMQHVRLPAGVEAWAVEYPGYCSAPGRPGADGAIRNATKVLGAALETQKKVTVVAFSVGTGVAMQMLSRTPSLATRANLEKVILVAPFSSVRDVALERAGGLASLVLRDQMNNTRAAGDLPSNSPEFVVLHGDLDKNIPHHQGVAVHESLERAGHNSQFHTMRGKNHFVNLTEVLAKYL